MSGLIVPLVFERCANKVTTRAPTYKEVEESREAGRLIIMTSEECWDPTIILIKLLNKSATTSYSKGNWEGDNLLESCSAICTKNAMLKRMAARVHVFQESRKVNEVISNERQSKVLAEKLVRK